jgi:hypothetical protein
MILPKTKAEGIMNNALRIVFLFVFVLNLRDEVNHVR